LGLPRFSPGSPPYPVGSVLDPEIRMPTPSRLEQSRNPYLRTYCTEVNYSITLDSETGEKRPESASSTQRQRTNQPPSQGTVSGEGTASQSARRRGAMRCHEAVQARAPARARARARASFWKTGSHQHRRRIREMQFRVKRAAPPSSHRSQGCQLPSAKPNVGHVCDKQGFDQAQAKHNHKQANNAIVAVQCSTVQ
jgi:hypothetical protein